MPKQEKAMHAVVFDASNKSFSMQQLAVPDLHPGEVLVKVTCCTICGSDMHTFEGRRSGPSPCVLGHEIIGQVDSWHGNTPPVDFSGKPIKLGQRITWSLAVGCGECFYCARDLPQKCLSLFKYGHALHTREGISGGLSEYCILKKGTPIFALDDGLPDNVACPANCATATVMAAIRVAEEVQSITDASIIITGMGMLGLTACAVLHQMGAKLIVAVDPVSHRLELARKFGASKVFDSITKSLAADLDQSFDFHGFDVALEFSGATNAVTSCIDSLRSGGVAVLAGSVFPTDPVPLLPEDIVRRVLTIRGIHNYVPSDLECALEFLTRHHREYPFESLVSRTFPLQSTEAAFRFTSASSPVRVGVIPDHFDGQQPN